MILFSTPPSARYRRWIFLAFLAALHMVMLAGPGSFLGRWLFLSHIGIGLLWQPFVQPRRRFGPVGAGIVLVAAMLCAYFLNWGFLLIWTMLLTGVVGGKVFLFHDRWERIFHLLGLGYLVTVVLAVVLPVALASLKPSGAGIAELLLYLMSAVFFVMAALPAGSNRIEERAEIVDFVYSVMLFLLLSVIVLGSLSFSLLFKAGYFEALLVALSLIAGLLLLLGFIWDPSSGFGGLGSAVAQYVMSLGLPVEDWLESLAELAKREEDEVRFMSQACAELPARLPGVLGGSWRVFNGAGAFGEQRGQAVHFAHGQLELRLLTRAEPSPSLLWHYDLVVRLLAEIHLGKWRAQELKRLSYIEAVHETGARLTHDVKNLLQSLDTLCVAAQHEGAQSSARFHELLRRQLPEIATRLRQTLAKLSAPGGRAPAVPPVSAADWLASLRARYPAEWLGFSAAGDLASCLIDDPALLSSIAENLLQNVIDKRHAEADIRAELRVDVRDGVVVEVSDTGAPIPAEIAAALFAQRVASESGLGIGLYQCARLAEAGGWRLQLAENRAGCVRFRLAPSVRGQAPAR